MVSAAPPDALMVSGSVGSSVTCYDQSKTGSSCELSTYSESSDTFWKLVKRLGITGIFKDSISLWGGDEPSQHLS